MREDKQTDRGQWIWCFLLQNLGILIGVTIMVLIGLYEDKIHSVEV